MLPVDWIKLKKILWNITHRHSLIFLFGFWYVNGLHINMELRSFQRILLRKLLDFTRVQWSLYPLLFPTNFISIFQGLWIRPGDWHNMSGPSKRSDTNVVSCQTGFQQRDIKSLWKNTNKQTEHNWQMLVLKLDRKNIIFTEPYLCAEYCIWSTSTTTAHIPKHVKNQRERERSNNGLISRQVKETASLSCFPLVERPSR